MGDSLELADFITPTLTSFSTMDLIADPWYYALYSSALKKSVGGTTCADALAAYPAAKAAFVSQTTLQAVKGSYMGARLVALGFY